ncbi:hypothetical protein CAPTEDRAFT_207008 [Capitella teleta]|uniref:DUF4806 domain-containing protein n=1 Tax=Capitella teleta TaxID=283909 RepID=R7UYA8_CAPTE|nr:hypothetical protein CAPTEDRAFT_207008 [Capitella teleta]|eukprot:ELU08932.1 hypothetical protein CAPTEDRAFT_207008 [Capitella teleta]
MAFFPPRTTLQPTPRAQAPPPVGRARDCSRPTLPLPRISKSRPEMPKYWPSRSSCSITAHASTNATIEQLLREVRELKSSAVRPARASLLDQVDLPITSMEAIENVEEMLKEKSFATAMFHHMASIGGPNVRGANSRAMAFLLGADLAQCFNWQGRPSWKTVDLTQAKRHNSTLKLTEIISKSISRSASFATTQMDVEKAMKA